MPDELRGTFAGLAHPAVLDHIQSIGVTTLSLMPVQQRVDYTIDANVAGATVSAYSHLGGKIGVLVALDKPGSSELATDTPDISLP